MRYKRRLSYALLFLICVSIFSGCSQTEEEKILYDFPPFVMYQDELYKNQILHMKDCTFEEVGTIESYVDYGLPTENNQANSNYVGCKIYTCEDYPDWIFILYKDVYQPYELFVED